MQMLRLNIRHALPQTAIQSELGRLDKNSFVPAQVHTKNRLGKSNQTATQVSVDLDNYPSRRAWGARNLTDLTREFGQKGISDVREATSQKTQIAWSRAENGGKPGNDIKQQYTNKIHAEPPKTVVKFELMEGPNITVTPSEIVGEPDVGDVTAEIETEPFADIHYSQGNIQTYLEDKGFIRRWISMGEYDIYA